MTLLESSELAAIRELGVMGMISPIAIYRREVILPTDPGPGYDPGYDPLYDFGDDELTYTYVDSSMGGDIGTPISPPDLKGWFVSLTRNLTRDITEEMGTLAVVDQIMVRVPVGTDIKPFDTVRRLDTGQDFTVVEPNDEDSWPEWTKMILIRQE